MSGFKKRIFELRASSFKFRVGPENICYEESTLELRGKTKNDRQSEKEKVS
jgi:hypothetical protein